MVEALKVECGQGYQHKNVTSANFRCEKFYTFRPRTPQPYFKARENKPSVDDTAPESGNKFNN